MDLNGRSHMPATLPLERSPQTHWIGGV